ncbi:zinc-ribbon domain-containing protein, partial [Megamonas funiformis]
MLKFCPNCGAKTLKNGKFCHECGYSLQEFNNESTITEKDIIDDTKEDIIIDNDGGD